MKAIRIHEFGSPDVLMLDDISRPAPQAGEVLVRVVAAGVGPWDAWIREGQSKVKPSLPLTPGSDIAGVVEEVGVDVADFKPGDDVYGATNAQFTGGYADYAVAEAAMIAPKPKSLSMVEAASAPVVSVTAWQMLFDYAKAKAGQTVLIHGAAGNVGTYAVQLAKRAGLKVATTAAASDAPTLRRLGADLVIDYHREKFEEVLSRVDIVLDTVGGETKQRSFSILKKAGILVSAVSANDTDVPPGHDEQAVFFLVGVTTARLNELTRRFDNGELKAQVGSLLPLEQARTAHEMLAGAPHARGKIVLQVA